MYLTEKQRWQIWLKAQYAGEKNEGNGFRKDQYGDWIKWSDYGNRNSQYGWEVDHIIATANGGSDDLTNLRPLHWKNNSFKSDNWDLVAY